MDDSTQELLRACKKALNIAESWIHDQLDGTTLLDGSLEELADVREAIAKAEEASSDKMAEEITLDERDMRLYKRGKALIRYDKAVDQIKNSLDERERAIFDYLDTRLE